VALVPLGLALALTAHAQTTPTVNLQLAPNKAPVPFDVDIAWSSTNSTTCAKSGDWSGPAPISGSQTIHLTTVGEYAYTLTCSNNVGVVALTWVNPTRNTNGTTLTDLAGDEVYHATTSDGIVDSAAAVLLKPPVTSYTLQNLPGGVRYFGIKAVNTAGVRSAMSAAVSQEVKVPTASATATVSAVAANPVTGATSSQVVTELKPKAGGGWWVNRKVGTIPLGKPCYGPILIDRSGPADFREINLADASITVAGIPVGGAKYAARCKPTLGTKDADDDDTQ